MPDAPAVNSLIHDHFLLSTKPARELYHDIAAPLPIIDYHCHLEPRDLAADRQFENIAQLWVTGDPYKHRAMRLAGVPEQAITGSADDQEKFERWAATVPLTTGNPLHHWTALELKRYFGIDEPLSSHSARRIWQACNAHLAEPNCSARGLLAQRKVACVCTSDRLLDDLTPHQRASAGSGGFHVLPSLRADDAVAIESPDFLKRVAALGAATNTVIRDYDAYCAALNRRLDDFSAAGCRLSDHGIDDFSYVSVTDSEASGLFAQRLRGAQLSTIEAVRLRSGLLRILGAEYARRGWILQLHLGAHRQTSSRLRQLAGPAGGYAAIGRPVDISSLATWLDELERAGALPRVVFYPLNPADFAPLAVLTGSYAEDNVPGKLQLGPAWWFNDHGSGMRAHLDAVANHSLLATFIGMTTDSRSLLSMVRHEYFRRVLCDWIGRRLDRGEWPADRDGLAVLVRALCYENARAALGLASLSSS